MDADDPSSTLFRAWEELAVAQATIQVMQRLVYLGPRQIEIGVSRTAADERASCLRRYQATHMRRRRHFSGGLRSLASPMLRCVQMPNTSRVAAPAK